MKIKQFFPKLSLLLIMWGVSVTLGACGSTNNTLGDDIRDYESEMEFETALNNGTNINGSTVVAKATTIAPDSKFGFNVQAGEHLNFIVPENSEIQVDGYYKFKVNSTQSFLGSWILYSDYLGAVDNQIVDRTVEEVIDDENAQPNVSEEAVISETEETNNDDESILEDDEVTDEEIIIEDDRITDEDTITEDDKLSDDTVIEESTATDEVKDEGKSEVAETTTTTLSIDNSTSSEQEITYVLNTNTKKFHKPKCSSVKKIRDENKKEVTWSRDEVISAGYDSCGNCHP